MLQSHSHRVSVMVYKKATFIRDDRAVFGRVVGIKPNKWRGVQSKSGFST